MKRVKMADLRGLLIAHRPVKENTIGVNVIAQINRVTPCTSQKMNSVSPSPKGQLIIRAIQNNGVGARTGVDGISPLAIGVNQLGGIC